MIRMIPTTITIDLITDVPAPVFTRSFLQRIHQACQRYIRFPKHSAATVRVVGDQRMQRLNQQYRGLAAVTDVLSFGYTPAAADIVICYPQAKRQATAKQLSFRRECAWLVIHGLLHWQGYDHETAAEARVMRPLEQKILAYGQF